MIECKRIGKATNRGAYAGLRATNKYSDTGGGQKGPPDIDTVTVRYRTIVTGRDATPYAVSMRQK
jgi:hypothetical protein